MSIDWTLTLRDPRSGSMAVHWVSEQEAKRIAGNAKKIGSSVVDGPRPCTEREAGTPRERLGGSKEAA